MVFICNDKYTNNDSKYLDEFEKYPYPLSDFQKYAIEAIIEGHHSLVTAHTGSGKTLPAEFAIKHFKSKNKKIVYTSPIKALSNQKYFEFSNKYPDISFGIFTGDIKVNPCADVLIMTTEILMNYLFSLDKDRTTLSNNDFELNIQDDLGCVIFDEVHYINDEHRGQNWEQTILMLPPHIQMVMLSATIDAPEKFAEWCETCKPSTKKVYLSSTHQRVVPLTHYGFLMTNEGVFKRIKDKETQQKIKQNTNKFIMLKSSKDVFNDTGHAQLKSTIDLFENNNAFMNKTHVLNAVVKQLNEEEMLPAIVFVFSRKNVESYAHSITTNILEFDSKVPYTMKNECDQVLRKLPNYREYMNLPEYDELVKLLEKGIGIHHSGMIPILREIVETMISRKKVKLLFATESFAIGLDCPIRTAVFTSLTKFDGSGMRYLYPHEYGQAAGRAGRRGLDTVGHVVHCNNMFELPSVSEYKEILCGKPQSLHSKFKVSFSTILSLMKNGKSQKIDFTEFTQKSMLNGELNTMIENEMMCNNEYKKRLEQLEVSVGNMRTPREVCERYLEIENMNKTKNCIFTKISNKQRKESEREFQSIKDEYKFVNQDVETVKTLNETTKDYNQSCCYIQECQEFIDKQICIICEMLLHSGYIEESNQENHHLNNYSLTNLGMGASNITEIHALVCMESLVSNDYYKEFSTIELIGFFSIFMNIKIGDEYRSSFPNTSNTKIKSLVNANIQLYEKYLNYQIEYNINVGEDPHEILTFDLIDSMQEWCALETEQQCKYFIQTNLNTMEVSIGEFNKGVLKISTIARELSKVCEKMSKVDLLYKLSKVDELILKFVATNQSIYV